MVYEYEIYIPLRLSGDRLIETPIPVPRGSPGKQEHIRLFRQRFFFLHERKKNKFQMFLLRKKWLLCCCW